MAPVGFEPTTPAGEGPQTYALDRAATGTGSLVNSVSITGNENKVRTKQEHFMHFPTLCRLMYRRWVKV